MPATNDTCLSYLWIFCGAFCYDTDQRQHQPTILILYLRHFCYRGECYWVATYPPWQLTTIGHVCHYEMNTVKFLPSVPTLITIDGITYDQHGSQMSKTLASTTHATFGVL